MINIVPRKLCENTFGYAFMTKFPIGWLAATDFLNLFTSDYEIEKPSLNSSLTLNWVGFLGTRFEKEAGRKYIPLSKTH